MINIVDNHELDVLTRVFSYTGKWTARWLP